MCIFELILRKSFNSVESMGMQNFEHVVELFNLLEFLCLILRRINIASHFPGHTRQNVFEMRIIRIRSDLSARLNSLM